MGMDVFQMGGITPAPLLWSLILNDDLTAPADDNHSNDAGRSLDTTWRLSELHYSEYIATIEIARIQWNLWLTVTLGRSEDKQTAL